MKHLKIEQSTSSIEVVDPKVIDKLYNLVLFHPVGESLDSTSNLKGNLQCSHAYGDVVDYLTTNYKDLSISVTGGIYIRFEDENVENICATNFGDGTGITTVQASVVNTLNGKFNNNTVITKFNELKNFINYTVLDGYAFQNCTNLTQIDLSNITKLGYQSFKGCSALKSVNLSSKCIDSTNWYGTFVDCVSLTDVGDVSGFPIVWNDTFSRCTSLVSVNLSSKCTEIGTSSFNSDTVLTSVGDVSGVTILGDSSFGNCTSLINLELSNKCTEIGNSTFSGCTSLVSVGDVSGVKTIGHDAFHQCNITSLNLTNVCTSISWSAFYQCNNLTTLGDTSNVVLGPIGNFMFYLCSKLTSITFKSTTITEDTKSMFNDCSNLTSITGDFTGITKFDSNMFNGCSKLYTLTLPSTLITLAGGVFSNCTSLTTITIPKSVISVGNGTFSQCTSLTSLNFETGGTGNLYLGSQVIKNCTSLNKLTLPANLTTIETDALGYHDNPTTIAINATTVPTLNGAIGGSSDTVFYVPDSSLSAYKSATNWSTMSSRIKGMSTYPIGTEIPSKAFQNWTGLANMDLTNVTLINDHAFAGSGLANNYTVGPMQICSSTVESTIKEWAFWGAEQIESITLPYVSNIGTGAFSDCTALQRVILGSHIVGIGNLCFQNCTALDFIHIDSTACPVLSSCAFDGAKSTFKIYVPDAQVSAYKAASVWSTFADKIYSFTQQDTDFPGTR